MVQKWCVPIGLTCLFLLAFSTNPQPIIFPTPHSPRLVHYEIHVRLDADKKIIHGCEKVNWRNPSDHPIKEIPFHLYLNAFRNNRSTYALESNRSWIDEKFPPAKRGYIDILRIVTEDGRDITANLQFIHPDDDNEEDRTVALLQLPEVIAPHGSIALNIDFKGKFPEPPIARSGARKEYLMAAQWFPKIGVYEDGAWNCHQYHLWGEFYADFGVYDVFITVPEKHLVGATGLEVARTKHDDGTVTHHYHAEDVHDFAWTTSPDFVEFTDQAQDVHIRLLMQKDHVQQAARHMQAAKLAVEYFQNTYGDYPFPNLTVVDPRRGASATGGMEYPTLITAGTFYGVPEKLRLPEMIILHEFGHNYWYHLTANNEFEEAWLDEGINTYSEIQIFKDLYGETGNMIDLLGLQLSNMQLYRWGYMGLPDRDPLVRRSWEFHSGNSYSVLSYYKAGLALTTLHNYLGRETMQQVMRAFLAQYRFKHSRTQDFVEVANSASGQDLHWFFDQVLYSNAVLDYSVTHVSSKLVDEKAGFDYTYSTQTDSVWKDTTKVSGEDSLNSAKNEKIYKNVVRVERLGSFIFPVELQVVFADGDTVREQWDGREYWKKFVYFRPGKIVSATVDPENKIPLDVRLVNNSRTLEAYSLGINKWAARGLFGLQVLMDLPEMILALLAGRL